MTVVATTIYRAIGIEKSIEKSSLIVNRCEKKSKKIQTMGGIIIPTNTIKPPTKYLNYAIISAWKKEMQEH
jgi:hypothetical protein